MSSNLALSGNASAVPPLWEQVRGLCWVMVSRYRNAATANKAVDMDDLMQSAYIAFCRAVKAYKPDEGAFNTILGYYVRSECQALLGLQTGREKKEHYISIPLDSPVSPDNDLTVGGTLEDESLPDMNESLELADLQTDVHEAINLLPDMQRAVILDCCLGGISLQEFGSRHGFTKQRAYDLKQRAFRKLRKSLKPLDYFPNYYRHKGPVAFFSERSSVVEDIVLRSAR